MAQNRVEQANERIVALLRRLTPSWTDLDTAQADRLEEALRQLKDAGMEISSADDDNSVVEGCIGADKLPVLRELDCVSYVRNVFTYVADYPTGDPRDRDG